MKRFTYEPEELQWNAFDEFRLPIYQKIGGVFRPILDADQPNPMGEALDARYWIQGDFDRDRFPYETDSFNGVLSLEVLEHLMNPLHYLDEIRRVLRPGGTLLLSTPCRPRWLWTERHFHEMRMSELVPLLYKAGFEILAQYGPVPIRYGWRFHLSGIRPLIRYFVPAFRVFVCQ